MLKVFSAFSGVGGLDLPFHADKRFKVIGHCEIDKWASAVLKYQFVTPNYGDITKLGHRMGPRLPEFDLLVAGFPCTDISFQGTQKGFAGVKSSLFKALVPIIHTHKPKFVLLENVEALLSSKFAMEFSYVIKSLNDQGYNVSYDVFDSSDYGVAQQRRRVLILATRADVGQYESNSLYAEIERRKIKDNKRKVIKPSNMVSWSRSTRDHHIDHRIREDSLANTLTTGKGCNGFSTGNFIVDGMSLRLLKPTECEALMGWPADWTKFGMVKDMVTLMSDTQRFRMIGNGVVSNIVEPVRELIWEINEATVAKEIA
jgi:DNA-cytosine methyltransferase